MGATVALLVLTGLDQTDTCRTKSDILNPNFFGFHRFAGCMPAAGFLTQNKAGRYDCRMRGDSSQSTAFLGLHIGQAECVGQTGFSIDAIEKPTVASTAQ